MNTNATPVGTLNLDQLVRPNIRRLQPYRSARDEFKGTGEVFLDANENPHGTYNRYPDPQQLELKRAIGELRGVPTEQIFVGNGSDEVIELALRIFCEPGRDKALTFAPTYGMYRVSTAINDVELIELPLNASFQPDLTAAAAHLNDPHLKLIFLCSPNNPTGNLLREADLRQLLHSFGGIVIIDEAYIDFADTTSWVTRLADYPNLIVSQTLSKAFGLAAARVGMAFASAEIIELFNRVKPPYNVSRPAQEIALAAVREAETRMAEVRDIVRERERVAARLTEIAGVRRVHPSDANFLLFEVDHPKQVYRELTTRGLVIRDRSGLIPGALRVTIGTAEENDRFLTLITELLGA